MARPSVQYSSCIDRRADDSPAAAVRCPAVDMRPDPGGEKRHVVHHTAEVETVHVADSSAPWATRLILSCRACVINDTDLVCAGVHHAEVLSAAGFAGDRPRIRRAQIDFVQQNGGEHFQTQSSLSKDEFGGNVCHHDIPARQVGAPMSTGQRRSSRPSMRQQIVSFR